MVLKAMHCERFAEVASSLADPAEVARLYRTSAASTALATYSQFELSNGSEAGRDRRDHDLTHTWTSGCHFSSRIIGQFSWLLPSVSCPIFRPIFNR